jgi:hypothetical protein
VINLSLLKAGDDRAVEAEMRYLADSAREVGATSKFIIEAGYLDEEEKVRICEIANRVGPDYLKTSTGYGPTGATVADVQLMRSVLRSEIHIKAAGGIRSYPQALSMLRSRRIAHRNKFRGCYFGGAAQVMKPVVGTDPNFLTTLVEINHDITSTLDLDQLLKELLNSPIGLFPIRSLPSSSLTMRGTTSTTVLESVTSSRSFKHCASISAKD